MREVLPVHEPLLVNTLGHSAGTLIFATFVYLLLRDRAGARLRGSSLTLTAAVLALAWNLASLVVIASGDPVSIAVSSSALSVLPAVLLHLCLGPRLALIRYAGYAVAAVAVALHSSEAFVNARHLHSAAMNVTTVGFGTLTLIAIVSTLRNEPRQQRWLASRLFAAMSLFLFSLSLVHLGESHTHSWPMELVAHHAGIVLALFVLLQDYRFLLLDAFLRFLVNILLAALFVSAAVRFRGVLDWAEGNPFRDGMVLAACCLALLLYASLRSRLEHWFNRLLLARRNVEAVLQAIRTYSGTEAGLLESAGRQVAEFFDCDLISGPEPVHAIAFAAPVTDLPHPDREQLERAGAEAVIPLRISGNDARHFLLGRRHGGKRYLSGDFADMQRVQAEMIQTLERLREEEMRRLMNQAELRALQAQINPHFLFNVLNTLYGVIPRQAEGARRTVLNLADIFRYFLNTERAFLPLEDELHIVRSYLEIEQLRLGSRLRWDIVADPDSQRVLIPTLTVEPLVENAVKHGIAPSAAGGTVRVEARCEGGTLRIRVSDSGVGFQAESNGGAGVGLENVRRRLKLSYGADTELRIETGANGTSVEFDVPTHQLEAAVR